MTEIEFRVKHSKLIEYYQLIEMRFKSACARLLADEEKVRNPEYATKIIQNFDEAVQWDEKITEVVRELQ